MRTHTHTHSVHTVLSEGEGNWACFHIHAGMQIRCRLCLGHFRPVWARAGTSQGLTRFTVLHVKQSCRFQLEPEATFASGSNWNLKQTINYLNRINSPLCNLSSTASLQSKRLRSCRDRSHGDQQTAFLDHLCRRDPPRPGPWGCLPVHWRAWPGPGRQTGGQRCDRGKPLWVLLAGWKLHSKSINWVLDLLKGRGECFPLQPNRNHLIIAINRLESVLLKWPVWKIPWCLQKPDSQHPAAPGLPESGRVIWTRASQS